MFCVVGVSSLRNLIAKQQDEDCPRVHILLCESLLAIYMALFIHALATYECNLLYRLTAHAFSHTMWPTIFGGGMKKLVHVVTAPEQTGGSYGAMTQSCIVGQLKH